MKFFKNIFNKKTDFVEEQLNNKIKLDTDVPEFTNIDLFDTSEYLKQPFEEIFNAVELDNWEYNFNYNQIDFKKGSITLTIDYSCFRYFKITRIFLTRGYDKYEYNYDLDINTYRYFYKVYSDKIRSDNEILQKKADRLLTEINSVIGKSTLRDSKIDRLLNGK